MPIGYVLYSKKEGKIRDVDCLQEIKSKIYAPLKYVDIKKIKNYSIFLSDMEAQDKILLCGVGTLSCFINSIRGINFECEVFYHPLGTDDDFAHELGYDGDSAPFLITKYIKNLPVVTVNGQDHRFINGVGYGIDGYCCEAGDRQSASDKPANYAAIAIKGLLFRYKPTSAKVTVDGVTHTYKKVWIASTMLGKYYGGMMTPSQDRTSGMLSALVFHDLGKLRALMILPSVFKGKYTKYKKYISILQGHKIAVEFDRPSTLQIDEKTVSGATSYTACMAM